MNNNDIMSFETIVSTMNHTDISDLITTMQLETDAIVVNQSDSFHQEKFEILGKKISSYTLSERGVGLSRNTGMMRSTADICIIADDDMIYRKGYLEEIKKAYKKYPDADIICFSLRVLDNSGENIKKLKKGRLRRTESLKIGTPMITFKRAAIQKALLSFSLLFGGGAKFGSGEDTLFIQEAYRKKMRIYQHNFIIADVHNTDSSWFKGYNEKFFFDKGALYRAAFPRFSKLMMLQFLIRRRNLFKNWTLKDAFQTMIIGSRFYENNKSYKDYDERKN